MSNRVIQLEFNEICPPLVERFMAAGELPNFKRLYDRSEIYTTDAGEQPPNLEPWIQWTTVHTGMSYAEHGLFNLDEGHRLPAEQIWSRLSAAGKKVWICGSMNVGHNDDINGFIAPDPWAKNVSSFPAGEFDDYLNFVRQNVQEHTNANARPGFGDTRRFIQFLVRKGLTLGLATRLVRQVLLERSTGKFRWQRASMLDLIQWNVFRTYWQKHRPEFSTLFLNSVAHFQHVYWRNMEPELFTARPDTAEQEEFQNAILNGYKVFDDVIGECLDMIGPGDRIVLLSALSQHPCLKYEDMGGKRHYRPFDFPALTTLAGIDAPYECSPVMTEEFLLRFETAEQAASAMAQLSGLMVSGEPAIRVRQDQEELMVGCGMFREVSTEERVVCGTAGNEGIAFFDLFYQIAEKKSGEHDPAGLCWMTAADGQQRLHRDALPLVAVHGKVMALMTDEEQQAAA
ncbi:MAG: hypothetical protein AAGG11_07110 [Pseudomonadota bacterium]